VKKFVLLVVVIIPVGLVLFVKFFGKNEYNLPVYYQNGYPAITDCTLVGAAVLEPAGLAFENLNRVNLIFYEPECESNLDFFNSQTERIRLNMSEADFINYITISSVDSTYSQEVRKKFAVCGLLIAEQKEENLKDWKCTGFIVMIDWKARIRGYYSGTDFEDIDRVILELNVMETIVNNE
jgi:protein SCO1/2